jgi:hypothetical protein
MPAAKKGLLAQLGRAKDDPYLHEMLDNIYARVFPLSGGR